jgi:hypothetical protein
MIWYSEDEPEEGMSDEQVEAIEGKKKWYNLLVNKLMQLVSQATTFYNLQEMGNLIAPNKTPIYRWFDDSHKAVMDVATVISEGTRRDLQLAGENMGESKALTDLSKVLIPTAISSPLTFGFENALNKQWRHSPLDRWFWSDEKLAEEEIKAIRLEAKENIKEEYKKLHNREMNDDKADKEARKVVPYKRKGMSYVEALDRLKNGTPQQSGGTSNTSLPNMPKMPNMPRMPKMP